MWLWFLDRMLPGLCTSTLVIIGTYLKLHFEKAWPYWGRDKKVHQ